MSDEQGMYLEFASKIKNAVLTKEDFIYTNPKYLDRISVYIDSLPTELDTGIQGLYNNFFSW